VTKTLLPIFLLLSACTAGSKDDTDTDPAGSDDTDVTDTDVDAPLPTGVRWVSGWSPIDLTPDGRTALVRNPASLTGEIGLMDTVTGEVSSATETGDPSLTQATGISQDLQISGAVLDPVIAGLWSPDTDVWAELESPYEAGCDVNVGGAFDVSGDGTVATGLMWDACWPAAFRWTKDGGVELLERLGSIPEGGSGRPVNRGTVLSGDGQVVGGFAALGNLDRVAARWTADGEGELLDPDATELPSEVMSIDGDGDTLAGQRAQDGWVWTEADGFVDIGRPAEALPADPVFPNAMTADGEVVLGAAGSEFFGVPVAFVWTRDGGAVSLASVLADAGVTVDEGYTLSNVLAVSDDGRVLVGNAFDADFMPVSFVIGLDEGVLAP